MNSHSQRWYKTASESEKEIFRKYLSDLLREGPVNLTFEKKDGTIREMRATLCETDLPVIEKKTDRVRKENNEVLSVFDMDKKEWRSCRFDSVIQFEFTLGK